MSGKVIAFGIVIVVIIVIIIVVVMMQDSSETPIALDTTGKLTPNVDTSASVTPVETSAGEAAVAPTVTPTPVADPSSLLSAIPSVGSPIVTAAGRSYAFYPQYVQDDYGASVGRAPAAAQASPKLLAEHCDSLGGKCIAFQSDGWLKEHPLPQHNWIKRFDDATKGMYMRADVVPKPLTRPAVSRASTFTSAAGKTYGFYRGFESRDGDLSYAYDSMDSPAKLSAKCDSQAGCVGFSSLGALKKTISPQSNWVYWTENPVRGLWVKE